MGNHEITYRSKTSSWEVRLELGSSDKDRIAAWTKKYVYTPGMRAGAD